MNERPLKRNHFKSNFHLPTTNFQSELLVLRGNKHFLLSTSCFGIHAEQVRAHVYPIGSMGLVYLPDNLP